MYLVWNAPSDASGFDTHPKIKRGYCIANDPDDYVEKSCNLFNYLWLIKSVVYQINMHQRDENIKLLIKNFVWCFFLISILYSRAQALRALTTTPGKEKFRTTTLFVNCIWPPISINRKNRWKRIDLMH